MTAAVETMAWKGEVPWHGLGFQVKADAQPDEWLKMSKCDWTVSKREMFFKSQSGSMIKSTEDFALVRDTDEFHLSTVGSTWKEVQNSDAFKFFDKFCK